MPPSNNNGGAYEVHASGAVVKALKRIQQQANDEGRGERVLQAIRIIWDRLHHDPANLGEPLYRLPALRLEIYCAIVRPLAIDFAICEDRPLVFIKGVRLMPREVG